VDFPLEVPASHVVNRIRAEADMRVHEFVIHSSRVRPA
jgi:hypothetical protein